MDKEGQPPRKRKRIASRDRGSEARGKVELSPEMYSRAPSARSQTPPHHHHGGREYYESLLARERRADKDGTPESRDGYEWHRDSYGISAPANAQTPPHYHGGGDEYYDSVESPPRRFAHTGGNAYGNLATSYAPYLSRDRECTMGDHGPYSKHHIFLAAYDAWLGGSDLGLSDFKDAERYDMDNRFVVRMIEHGDEGRGGEGLRRQMSGS